MSRSYRTELQINPTAADVVRLEERLRDFNRSQVENPARLSFLIRLLDHENSLVGGLFARISYGWLFVDMLWVAEENRGKGQGGELLRRAEEEARRNGCLNAWVDTFSFQARGFYEKNGYVVFGELADYPPGHTRHFLRKPLA
jgi:GNAT superfamily N-acetyltransferase